MLRAWQKLPHLPGIEKETSWKCGHKPGKKPPKGINWSEASRGRNSSTHPLNVGLRAFKVKSALVYEHLDPHIPPSLHVVNNVPPSLHVVNEVKPSTNSQSYRNSVRNLKVVQKKLKSKVIHYYFANHPFYD
jgi:hypothetical protein